MRKNNSDERIGLTVSYSCGNGSGSGSDDAETCTEVYISDIAENSVAHRDGRLRQGDQILQVCITLFMTRMNCLHYEQKSIERWIYDNKKLFIYYGSKFKMSMLTDVNYFSMHVFMRKKN